MSQAPYAVRGIRGGTRYGVDQQMEDTLAHALIDHYPTVTPMGVTAENLATKYGITRQDCDDYALLSQKRWAAAQEAGRFTEEIVPVTLKSRKGNEEFAVDECPRPATNQASLAKLKPVFIKDTGAVTAGNASAITDGAASLIVASADAVKSQGITPLARIVSWYYCGVDPNIMVRNNLNNRESGLCLQSKARLNVQERRSLKWIL
jgi:acetyl-CoA acyltransferase 2